MSEKRCYTVKEVQEILDVSRPTDLCIIKKERISLDPVGWWKVQNFKKEF